MTLSRFSGQYRAVSFNYGGNGVEVPDPLVVVAAPGVSGAATLTVQNGWFACSDGTIVTPFNTNAPVSVVNASGVDTQTPSAVSTYVQSNLFGPTATVTATWTNAHYPGDRISSGTVGLQEAINFANSKGGGIVIIDADWVQQGGTTAILNAASLPSNGDVQILDNRGGQGAGVQTLSTVLTSAQITTLNSVGVPNLIPAPGAGNLIEIDRLWIECVPNTTAYTGGGNITLAYGTQAAQVAASAVIAATIFTTSGTVAEIGSALPVTPANTPSSNLLNKGVGLFAATADFAAGNTTAIVKVSYRILTGF
jgi:hypothetical protein